MERTFDRLRARAWFWLAFAVGWLTVHGAGAQAGLAAALWLGLALLWFGLPVLTLLGMAATVTVFALLVLMTRDV